MHISVEPRVHERLQKAADDLETSISSIVRGTLGRALEEELAERYREKEAQEKQVG